MRRLTILCLAVGLGLAFLPTAGFATVFNLTSTLNCANASAGAGTCGAGGSGTGSAAVTYDDGTGLLSWNVTWSGLSALETVAHFHGAALPSQNAGVQVGITASSPSVGTSTISGAQATDLLAGLWYLNIHSTAFPGGEIRGQVVPEPTTLLLLGSGIAALGLFRNQQLQG